MSSELCAQSLSVQQHVSLCIMHAQLEVAECSGMSCSCSQVRSSKVSGACKATPTALPPRMLDLRLASLWSCFPVHGWLKDLNELTLWKESDLQAGHTHLLHRPD